MAEESEEIYVLGRDDLASVLEMQKSADVRKLLAAEGVFVVGSQDHIPHYVERYAFPARWYTELCSGIFGEAGRERFSGLRSMAELDDAAEQLRTLFIANAGRTEDIRVLNVADAGQKYDISVEYVQRYPSKIAVLRRERRSFRFRLHEGESGLLEVTALVNDEKDIRTLGVLLRQVHKALGAELLDYRLESLSVQGRVELFDKLMDTRAEWEVANIKKLDIHNGPKLKGDEFQLLRKAVLEGTNLREHAFVKSLVDDGYFFRSVRLEIKTQSDVMMDLDIAFKSRPRGVVVMAHSANTEAGDAEPSMVHQVLLDVWRVVLDEFDLVREAEQRESKSADRDGS